jgi:acrylyl-CoA reductase (NADPH)/3-hydroxypropionyl-CoA dehydratase/3-hydroxypropionyl-CoA synthetase
VINVSGHRIGTEEIEGAILRDKVLRPDSPLGNAVVVGAPHEEKGETPVAFVIPAPGRSSGRRPDRLKGLVRSEKGVTAVPSDFLVVSAFPETRSGKYMRRRCARCCSTSPLGDLSTLRNPESSMRSARPCRVARLRPPGRGPRHRADASLPAGREPSRRPG